MRIIGSLSPFQRNSEISSCVFGTTDLSNMHEIIDSSSIELKENHKLLIKKTFNQLNEKISI